MKRLIKHVKSIAKVFTQNDYKKISEVYSSMHFSSLKWPKVYIASPYSLGNKLDNVIRQLEMADKLMTLGIAPYIPLLNHYQQEYFPRQENDWLNLDLQFMRSCDAIIRIKPIIDGKELPSLGADIEEHEARRLGIPVFYSIEELKTHFKMHINKFNKEKKN